MNPEIAKLIQLPDVGHALGVVLVGAAFVVALLFVVGFALRSR